LQEQNAETMATYSITIDEKSSKGKNLLNFLKTLDDVITIVPTKEENHTITRSEFLNDMKQSLHQAKTNQTKPLKNLINGK
jgi:hypothetical protein